MADGKTDEACWVISRHYLDRALPANTKRVRISVLPQIAFAAFRWTAPCIPSPRVPGQDNESLTAFIIRSSSILNGSSIEDPHPTVGPAVTLGVAG